MIKIAKQIQNWKNKKGQNLNNLNKIGKMLIVW